MFADYADLLRRFELSVHGYNFQRHHQGIEGSVPADRFFSAAPQVKAAIQANTEANALRMSLQQPVRKPFYLVGQLGDQNLSLAASGGELRVQMGNEAPRTIPMPREKDRVSLLCNQSLRRPELADIASLCTSSRSLLVPVAGPVLLANTIVFVKRKEGGVARVESRPPRTEARDTIIGPEHALASGAIPLLFRSVRIGEEFFCDGSVRQNTPLSPALRLGADRVLVLTLRHKPAAPPPMIPMRSAPSTPLLVGKVLNALMQDPTEYDLDRLRRFNGMIEAGEKAFGPEFLPRINEAIRELRGQPYRPVRELVIRPSRDLSEVAADLLRQRRVDIEDESPLPARWLRRFTQSQLFTQADLASYLLFDGGYASQLIQMGMDDAHARRDQLESFFAPAPAS